MANISAEQDPTLKSAKLASLCSALWLERGVQLVVVGGSAISQSKPADKRQRISKMKRSLPEVEICNTMLKTVN